MLINTQIYSYQKHFFRDDTLFVHAIMSYMFGIIIAELLVKYVFQTTTWWKAVIPNENRKLNAKLIARFAKVFNIYHESRENPPYGW